MARSLRALVADVGGTKIDFAICEGAAHGAVAMPRARRVASAEQSSFEAAATGFLGGERVDVAVIAVAGPVVDGMSQLTNLPWRVERRALERVLGAPVDLLNDFAALGYAVPRLGPGDVLSLAARPRDEAAPFALIGAGTGLGEAVFLRASGRIEVLAGEGGHADFAPRDEREVRLWRALKARYGRVSVERVLSGQGLAAVHAFLRVEALHAEVGLGPASTPPPLLEPAEVSRLALAAEAADPIAREALALWLSLYGAEAGNLALRVVPRAGLYIAGGIAQKLGPRLADGEWLAAFYDKDPMRAVLDCIPVDVILHPNASLIGAFERALVVYQGGLTSS